MSDGFKASITRRGWLMGAASLPLITGCETSKPHFETTEVGEAALAELEARAGGRLGVTAVNLQTGKRLSHRGDERFAICSSFKWLLGIYYAYKMRDNWSIEEDALKESWDRFIPFSKDDLVSYSPVTEPRLADGGMTLGELCGAVIKTSDNTAANVLLRDIGGPEALTAFIRTTGDEVTRLDRWEPDLNAWEPGDNRDTTTPNSMAFLMSELLLGRFEARNDVRRVHDWMIEARTGLNRIRAGVTDEYIVGDKTGTNTTDHNVDVAIVKTYPVFKGMVGPVAIASYYNTKEPQSDAANAVHAEVGRIVMKSLVPPLFGEQPWKD
tara:strand:- start:10211 stop:11185 length:975 start_codon:yes stop_codon:yes gene_type:complete